MNIVDRVNFNYVIDLLTKRIEGLESELKIAKEQLGVLVSGQGLTTRRRKKNGGRKRAPKFDKLEGLIETILDGKVMKTGAIFKQVNGNDPQFSYEDVRRTLGRMKQLERPKKGTWRKKGLNVT